MARCGDGKACAKGGDCQSGVCPVAVCAAPKCDDKVKNGSETDIDCGGGCAKCAPGQACGQAADCASGKCESAACVALRLDLLCPGSGRLGRRAQLA